MALQKKYLPPSIVFNQFYFPSNDILLVYATISLPSSFGSVCSYGTNGSTYGSA